MEKKHEQTVSILILCRFKRTKSIHFYIVGNYFQRGLQLLLIF